MRIAYTIHFKKNEHNSSTEMVARSRHLATWCSWQVDEICQWRFQSRFRTNVGLWKNGVYHGHGIPKQCNLHDRYTFSRPTHIYLSMSTRVMSAWPIRIWTDLTIDQWLSMLVNGQQPEKLLGVRIEDWGYVQVYVQLDIGWGLHFWL